MSMVISATETSPAADARLHGREPGKKTGFGRVMAGAPNAGRRKS